MTTTLTQKTKTNNQNFIRDLLVVDSFKFEYPITVDDEFDISKQLEEDIKEKN